MVTLLDVSAVAGHHAMPAALLFPLILVAIKQLTEFVCHYLNKDKLRKRVRNQTVRRVSKK